MKTHGWKEVRSTQRYKPSDVFGGENIRREGSGLEHGRHYYFVTDDLLAGLICQNQRIGEQVVLLMGILNMVSSEMEQSTCA